MGVVIDARLLPACLALRVQQPPFAAFQQVSVQSCFMQINKIQSPNTVMPLCFPNVADFAMLRAY